MVFAFRARLEVHSMLLIGIDQSDQYHDIVAINEGTGEVDALHITNDQKGFLDLDQLIHCLGFSSRPDEVLVALETPKGLLVSHILEKGHVLYPLNPKAVVRYRDRHRLSGAKSDSEDALVLAHILRTDRHRHRAVLPDSELVSELKMVTRDHSNLIRQKTRLTNQLTASLKEYYPAALAFFGDVASGLTLAFLKAYPDPESAAKATVADLEALLRRQQAYRAGKAEAIYAMLQEQDSDPLPLVVRTKSRFVLVLVEQLQSLVKAIDEYEREISRLVSQHPVGIIFDEIKGVGVVLAGRMLGEIGDCKQRYPTKEALQAMAGTAPVTRQSGKALVVRFRRACQKHLRNVLQQLAMSSLRSSVWAREYYDGQRARGHRHQESLRALANRWLGIIWKLWQTESHYDETYHQNRRQQHAMKNAVMV